MSDSDSAHVKVETELILNEGEVKSITRYNLIAVDLTGVPAVEREDAINAAVADFIMSELVRFSWKEVPK